MVLKKDKQLNTLRNERNDRNIMTLYPDAKDLNKAI